MSRNPLLALLLSTCLAGCLQAPAGSRTPSGVDAPLVKGPPITDITTEFDDALACLNGAVPEVVTFAVGQIADNTGKEQYADGGTGKLVTQGAGDMVQSALFRAGLSVVNRRDPNIILAENNWGIRNVKTQRAADLFISGSINSLDYIPGGGAEVEIAGIGPRYRQNRILVGLDLALTSASTGEIIANVPLQKQLFAEEMGFSVGRFFGDTLVSAEAGGMEREALHFTLRQMLSYATFDLLAQVLPTSQVTECGQKISTFSAVPNGVRGSKARAMKGVIASARIAAQQQQQAEEALAASVAGGGAPGAGAQAPGAPAGAGAPKTAAARPAAPLSDEARKLANSATSYAARAISSADGVLNAKTIEEGEAAASEAVRYMTLAIQALRAGATAGLTGPEGDAAATVVEQAINATEAAQKLIEKRKAKAAEGAATKDANPAPVLAPAPQETAPDPAKADDKQLGGAKP